MWEFQSLYIIGYTEDFMPTTFIKTTTPFTIPLQYPNLLQVRAINRHTALAFYFILNKIVFFNLISILGCLQLEMQHFWRIWYWLWSLEFRFWVLLWWGLDQSASSTATFQFSIFWEAWGIATLKLFLINYLRKFHFSNTFSTLLRK